MKILRCSVNEMRKKMNETREDSIATEDLNFRTVSNNSASAIEDEEYVALRAAIAIITDMPPSECSDDFKLSHKLYTTQLLMLNKKAQLEARFQLFQNK